MCVCTCPACVRPSPLGSGRPLLALHRAGAPGPALLLDALLHVVELLGPEEGAAAPRPVALIQGHCGEENHVVTVTGYTGTDTTGLTPSPC